MDKIRIQIPFCGFYESEATGNCYPEGTTLDELEGIDIKYPRCKYTLDLFEGQENLNNKTTLDNTNNNDKDDTL